MKSQYLSEQREELLHEQGRREADEELGRLMREYGIQLVPVNLLFEASYRPVTAVIPSFRAYADTPLSAVRACVAKIRGEE